MKGKRGSSSVVREIGMMKAACEMYGPRARCVVLLTCTLGVLALGLPRLLAAPDSEAEAKAPQYETDIKPLFQAKCLRCHGGKSKKADLDLSTPAALRKGGESGPAIVPGKPEESRLFQLVRDGKMPAGENNRLTPAEVDVIRRWIAAGARAEDAAAADAALTQYDVLPILLRRCTVCHGPRQQEGGLDLHTRAAMLRGGKSGPAMVPGKPEASLLLKKVHAGEMPPRRRLIEVSVKPMEPAEIELVTRWIAQGAPEVNRPPDVAGTTPDPLVSDKERAFWSFRPPQPVAVPVVRQPDRVRNPIDAFILHRLEEKGLTFAPEADRATLLRRVCFDLTGLPPEPAEVGAFLADPAPDAYEKAVDRLLASPRYGERWGRDWLDLAGYADSEGKREQDLIRPHAYRYRDYVIRSLNADKPYDRFLLEQIAGDELADYEHVAEITPEMYDNLVATGFLRMAPDPTWYNLTNFVPDRLEVIADEIDVLGSGVMGLTLKCARCHSHKFDPLPQRDYYRLVDIFKGAYDEHDWMKSNWLPGLSNGPRSDRDLPHVSTAERKQWEGHNAGVQKVIDAQQAALEQQAEPLRQKYRAERLAQLPAVLHDDLRAMLATAPERRSEVQRYLAEKFEKTLRLDRDELKKLDVGFKKRAEETEAKVRELESQRLPEPKIRALWDRGEPSPTYVLRRGDYLNPGQRVGPGVPSVLTDGRTPLVVTPPWPGAKQTGRRLAFARWLTQPDNPLTARVLVNRMWKQHFGAGIVRTLGNFGKIGARPTHPELLDWLAVELVQQGWSLKALHRMMVSSTTYRQSSALTPEQTRLDPDNALCSRMPLTRLSAEMVYDTLLLVAGRLDETRYGPADRVEVRADGLVLPTGTARGWRRSIYVLQQRKQLPTLLEDFDLPQMNPNCLERRDSTVAPQALHLMNNGLIQQLAGHFAERVRRTAGGEPGRQAEWVYRIALGRMPNAEEERIGSEALAQLTAEWGKKVSTEEAPRRALATYCHAILNSAAFLYVD
jgi:mono/diheme cytochrome c family protein